jgi:hypothetical protein
MRIDVVRGDDLGKDELERWRRAHAGVPRGPARPVTSPDYALCLLAGRPAGRVAVMEHDGARGWFPFVAGGPTGAPLRHGLPGIGALTHEPGFRCDIGTLMRACGWYAWPYHRPADRPLPAARGRRAGVAERGTVTNPVIDLGRGWDAWLADLRERSSSTLPRVLRNARRLRRDHDVVIDQAADDPAAVRAMLDAKAARMRALGHPARLAPDETTTTLVHRLATLDRPTCRGALAVLRVDGHPAAFLWTVRDAEVMSGLVTSYTPAHARRSPGLILLLAVLEHAAARGVTLYDMGPGDQPYKLTVATGTDDLVKGVLLRPGPLGTALWARHAGDHALRQFILDRPRLRARVQDGLAAYAAHRARVTTRLRRPGPNPPGATRNRPGGDPAPEGAPPGVRSRTSVSS